MRFKLNIPEYSIKTEYAYTHDVLNEQKDFPILTIGKDSYIEEAIVENVLDSQLIYNLQIGRYSAIASDVTFIIDLNHDYKRVCQGRIHDIPYRRPELSRRKGQIIIMNDCWIGAKATIMSGVTIGNGAVVSAEAVVSKDVPPYAIVAGNPAHIIGYRFEPQQIEALQLIRWWNWSPEKITSCAEELYGDIDTFISKHIDEAKQDLSAISPVDIAPIEKHNQAEEKRLFYIPDFEQDYPTWPRVIEAYIQSYADTNYELLLYVEEDDFLQHKLALLDELFSKYEDANCYINLYVGNIENLRTIMCQADAYITNRSLNNVACMDMADLFHLPVYSSVDMPVFHETVISHMVRKPATQTPNNSLSLDTLKTITKTLGTIQDNQEHLQNTIIQISRNQAALDSTIDNLQYEILDTDKPVYPIIEPIENTISQIINEGKSMCRFGDGEFSLIAGEQRHRFHAPSPKLTERLLEVLHSDNPHILICIPDMYGDLSQYNMDSKYNMRLYLTNQIRQQHYTLLDLNRHYHNAHITRPYAIYADNHTSAPRERFAALKKIWDNRKLLIIEGEKTRMGIGNDLFDNAADIIRILGPAESAFDHYDDILAEALKQEKDRLVLIALGATATVLAYDLANAGFQALDIGHIDIEYEWMRAGDKVAIHNKYVNEVKDGYMVEDIHNPVYESQIIARII